MTSLLALLFVPLLAQDKPNPFDYRGWLDMGVAAYKAGNYQEAIEALKKAASLRPAEVEPRLHLAAACLTLYVPGATTMENLANARSAEWEFQRVLTLDPKNETALRSLAVLSFSQHRFDEAKSWFKKLLEVDPADEQAHYSLGVIAWQTCFHRRMAARAKLEMEPADPGPIADAAMRQDLRASCWPKMEEGILHLEKALQLDPAFDDAMAYMNLLLRERADLQDTEEDYARDVGMADEWVHRTLRSKSAKASVVATGIHVHQAVQESRLIRKVAPAYPPLAREGGIEGVVRLSVLIGADGRVTSVGLISGHPLLAPSAIEAVEQWQYEPPVTEGQLVEVNTIVELRFSLRGLEAAEMPPPGSDHDSRFRPSNRKSIYRPR